MPSVEPDSSPTGLATMAFDGSAYMDDITFAAEGGNLHWFLAFQANAINAYHNIMETSSVNWAGEMFLIWIDTDNKIEFRARSDLIDIEITSGSTVGSWMVLQASVMDSTTSILWVDEEQQTMSLEDGGVGFSGTEKVYQIFNRGGGSSFNGQVGEILGINSALTIEEQTYIRTYLNAKWITGVEGCTDEMACNYDDLGALTIF